MTSATRYRDADYDIDKHVERTASWPDGLHEAYRFVPNLSEEVRRTNSAGDVSRYERYFALARSNRGGEPFTWRHYLQILGDELRRFDTLLVMEKMLLLKVATRVSSEISNYATASEFESASVSGGKNKRKKRSFFKKEGVGGDGESVSSMDSIGSNASLTPQTNLLKKMCSEIRTLARKTCKTVEKMSTKSKYCSACGDFIGNVKVHKKCSQSFGDYSKPLTPSMMRGSNASRIRSMTFDSPVRTPPSFAGQSVATKLTFAPHAVCRTKPFIKRSPKEEEG